MNTELIRKWVDALRSGDFQQGQHALTEILPNSSQRHCCLGVLCSLLVQDGRISSEIQQSATHDEKYVAYDGQLHTGLPSQRVKKMVFGEDDDSSTRLWWVNLPDGAELLDTLNDNGGYTFDQIADVIEANWLRDEVAP